MVTALDTNVLSGLLAGTAVETERSRRALLSVAEDTLVVSAPVFAELTAVPGADEAYIETFLRSIRVDIDWQLTESVWRQAAATFRAYVIRRRKQKQGAPKRVLNDFVIGAHAVQAAGRLLTFDKRVYSAAFPELELLS